MKMRKRTTGLLAALCLSALLLGSISCGCTPSVPEDSFGGEATTSAASSAKSPTAATTVLPASSGETTARSSERTVRTSAGGSSVRTTSAAVPTAEQTYAYRRDPAYTISMENTASKISLTAGGQRVTFWKNSSGAFLFASYVKKDGKWVPFFDAALPLIQGNSFNACPTSCRIVADTEQYKAVLLSGVQERIGYSFDILVEVFAGNPLVHFQITNHLKNDLRLGSQEPLIMLWRKGTSADLVRIQQETPRYQSASTAGYSGFPASYMYTDGMESAVYFDVSPMTWYSRSGLNRFNDCQVRTVTRNGMTGIGMDIKTASDNKTIKAGDMVCSFYLYGNGEVDKKPTKLQALSKAVNAFAYCLPATTASPKNYQSGELSYSWYSRQIIKGMMLKGLTYQWERPRSGVWSDGPMFRENTVTRILNRPGYVAKTDMSGSNNSGMSGDWNCNNNTLIPWVLIERLFPDAEQNALIDEQTVGLASYFDYKQNMFRSFDMTDSLCANMREFTFQNFFMQQGVMWVNQFSRLGDFNAANGGKYLLAADAMVKLAHNVGYIMPQLVDMKNLGVGQSIDEPQLGAVREPWSGGFYVYNMCLAYDLTGKSVYLNEAKTMLKKLFTGASFYVNDLKEKKYSDPYEFPVNEVVSAAWGVAGAQWLYRFTGDKTYLTYANDMRNLTLRMMKWYESGLADDPIDRSLGQIAFFSAFSNTDTTCPWETIQTYLPLLMELKNQDAEPSQVLLKAFNLFRINGYSLSGASWDPKVIRSASAYLNSQVAYYCPEDFYSSEVPTYPGQNGANNYMSNAILYAYILYEAYAQADSREIMTVNVDICDGGQEMANGIRRNFVVFNPTRKTAKCKVLFKDLNDKYTYRLTVKSAAGEKTEKTFTGKQLKAGVAVTLGNMEHQWMTVSLEDKAALAAFDKAKQAQRGLTEAYAYLQTAGKSGVTAALTAKKAVYTDALKLYEKAEYDSCIHKLKTTVFS